MFPLNYASFNKIFNSRINFLGDKWRESSSITNDLRNLTISNMIFEELNFKLYAFGIRVVMYQATVILRIYKLKDLTIT